MAEKFIVYTEEKSLKSKKKTNTTVFGCAVVGLISQDYFFFLRSLIRVDWFYNVKNIWYYWNTVPVSFWAFDKSIQQKDCVNQDEIN